MACHYLQIAVPGMETGWIHLPEITSMTRKTVQERQGFLPTLRPILKRLPVSLRMLIRKSLATILGNIADLIILLMRFCGLLKPCITDQTSLCRLDIIWLKPETQVTALPKRMTRMALPEIRHFNRQDPINQPVVLPVVEAASTQEIIRI